MELKNALIVRKNMEYIEPLLHLAAELADDVAHAVAEDAVPVWMEDGIAEIQDTIYALSTKVVVLRANAFTEINRNSVPGRPSKG